MPPYLAGRTTEREEYAKLLRQKVVFENPILTGLRGIGKTVLLETFKPLAIESGWVWAGTDLSEASTLSEENIAVRLLADLSVVTSHIVIDEAERPGLGLTAEPVRSQVVLDFATLQYFLDATPGLMIDKLKAVLELVWPYLEQMGKRGLIFAYDEAQNLADHAAKEQYPLSLLLDVFQSLQRRNLPILLVLAGLPTLFPKLVEARTYAERMFHLITLQPLTREETRDAIHKPIADKGCPVTFSSDALETIWQITRGYPYFIQFVCRECFDVWLQAGPAVREAATIPVDAILRKLDADFFAGRWARATDRQRDLLGIIAQLPNADDEFSVQDLVEHPANRMQGKAFSNSHANQILGSLVAAGLVYKNRHGKYVLAVPLLSGYIKRILQS